MTWESADERDALADDRDRELWIAMPRPCGAAESGDAQMAEVYTITQLRNDEVLRRLAGEVLGRDHKWLPWPQPYMHWRCEKCGAEDDGKYPADIKDCGGSDIDRCSLLDISEALVKKFSGHGSSHLAQIVDDYQCRHVEGTPYATWYWFIFKATPAERCVCCLLALLPEKVTVTT